jgi:dTDP-4-dehydrorhamnose reductase
MTPGSPQTKCAIIGADGSLGARLYAAARPLWPDLAGTSRRAGDRGFTAFDLTAHDPAELTRALAASGHTHAVICAAATGIMRCQQQPDATWRVNVDGTLALVRALDSQGLKAVYLSSDNVFDGEKPAPYCEADPTNPINEYGRQKAAVERGIAELGPAHVILRLTKAVGTEPGDGLLIDELASRLSRGDRVLAAWDQLLTPIEINELARIVLRLVQSGLGGLFHVASTQVVSRYDLAVRIMKTLGLGSANLARVSLRDIDGGAFYPKNNALDAAKLIAALGSAGTPVPELVGKYGEAWRKKLQNQGGFGAPDASA